MRWPANHRRVVTGTVATLAVLAVLALSNLWLELWQLSAAEGTFSMAPALPACHGLWLREGFTYLFRDPHRGEIITFHARGQIGGEISPDSHSRQLEINKRVIGIPGDTVVGRSNRVYVNGRPADGITTNPFPAVHLGAKQYFVMGDNRSASHDSRDFGPVPRAAIFSRAVLIVWPLARVGVPQYNKHARPAGILCSANP